jgi:hypothetical protein
MSHRETLNSSWFELETVFCKVDELALGNSRCSSRNKDSVGKTVLFVVFSNTLVTKFKTRPDRLCQSEQKVASWQMALIEKVIKINLPQVKETGLKQAA